MPLQTGQILPANFTNIGPDTVVPVGSALTLINDYAEKVITLNSATGSVATLPAAIGSGLIYKFLQTAAAPSSPHKIQVTTAANTNGQIGDYMIGSISTIDAAAVTGYIAANSATISTNSDTITLSATTSGGLSAGSWITLQDVLPNTWSVCGMTSSSGTAVTPFSAAVT